MCGGKGVVCVWYCLWNVFVVRLKTDGLAEGVLGGVCDPLNLEAKLRGRAMLAFSSNGKV